MKVLLIDVDSTIPSLPLMKISAYHKSQGDEVGRTVSDPDLIYASIVFEQNRHLLDGLKHYYPNAKIIIGGPGYNLKDRLPDMIDRIKPDYDLYPNQEYSMGHCTRGCIRHCHFCVVPEKEGRLIRWQHPREFHDDRFNAIMLYDNNWLADREWFFETSEWIIRKNLKIKEGGMDVRLVDEEIADQLVRMRFVPTLYFAWDYEKDEERVLRGIEILRKAGIDLRHKTWFYVYMDNSSQTEYDSVVRRCRILKSLGVEAFVMFNIRKRKDKKTSRLQRWSLKPWLYWSIDIDDYDRSVV